MHVSRQRTCEFRSMSRQWWCSSTYFPESTSLKFLEFTDLSDPEALDRQHSARGEDHEDRAEGQRLPIVDRPRLRKKPVDYKWNRRVFRPGDKGGRAELS